MNTKKSVEKKSNKRKKHDMYSVGIVITLVFLLASIVVISLYIHSKLRSVKKKEARYDYHFAFISKSEDSYITEHIYEEAFNYGRQHDAYVEKLNAGSNGDYSVADYVEMAASMKADGIILEGNNDEELRKMIENANGKGIPTITLLSDCPGSGRKSFVEIGNYNLGREYARIIINTTHRRRLRVTILMDDSLGSGDRTILNGIRETLANEGNHLNVSITIENIKDMPNFRLSEKVKDLLSVKEDAPDFLICLNEHDTKITYQAIKDYDLSGRSQMLGNGISVALLRAIKDGDITALIDVDSKQMGSICIDALLNYKERGYTSEHIIAEDTVVTKDNVERYLDEK